MRRELKPPLPYDLVPGQAITREEEAKRALAHTRVTPALAWFTAAAFLVSIALVPVLQHAVEIADHSIQRPQSWKLTALFPSPPQIVTARSLADVENLLPQVSELKSYEDALEDDSVVSQWILPRAQRWLTSLGGAGNEQAYVGRDGWLFYRPDVEYLTSPGFLDPALLTTRRRAGDADSALVQPDPIPAIVDFRNQLAARGIELILLPVPVKPMLHPEKLSGRYGASTLELQNPSYSRLLTSLHESGVAVIDPTPALVTRRAQQSTPQFLERDTHWTPQAMEAVAQSVASELKQRALAVGQQRYSRRATVVENLGDTAEMLALLDSQNLYRKQRVELQQVFDSSGVVWSAEPTAQVLVLGDSFSNIYSQTAMGWGEGAGLPAQLSFHLQAPVDAVVVNAGGSHTSRQRLVQELQRDRKRLAGTKIVLWQFSMRDLSQGDWKILKLPG